MLRVVVTTLLLVGAMALDGVASAATVHKCVINGTVTFQSVPCPAGARRKSPTVDPLDAQRLQKPRQGAGSVAAPTTARRPPVPRLTDEPKSTFTCDGRTHCSQMTSCNQARYFLAHCPGTRMDGDRDGIPCEQQWCR